MGLGDSITYGSGDTSVTNIHQVRYFQRAIQQGWETTWQVSIMAETQ